MNKKWILTILAGFVPALQADVILPSVIDSKMVIQQGREASIWGWAGQNEEVVVEFAGQVKKASPDASGKWLVKLDPLQASAEPRSMTIKGKNKIVLNDVLVGEVWLAAGQSNMDWTFAQSAPEEWELAQRQKDNKLVRAFHVEQNVVAATPMDDVLGRWKDCSEMLSTPRSVSSVGFFFATKLQEALGVPVAFMDVNWGGRPIEAFIAPEGYEATGLQGPTQARPTDLNVAAQNLRQLKENLEKIIQANNQGHRMGMPGTSIYGGAPNEVHHAMIAPLAPYTLRGAIWYQGEANRGRPDYFEKLKALSAGWSSIFELKDFPILQVQIAPNDYTNGANPMDSTLCETVWTAQYRAAKEIPGMGLVAIHDTGINVKDIHPKNKKPVGERLAALALKSQYGKAVVAHGPRFASAKRAGSKVVVAFEDIGEGLTTSDGNAPSWFEVSADGKTFVSADAFLVGNEVHIGADLILDPKFVRMGWRDIALPNLKDKNGWPVFAFPAQAVAEQ